MGAVRKRGLPGGSASVADKRFKRSEIRPGRHRRSSRRWLRLAGLVLVAASGAGVGVMVTARAVRADFLAVDRIRVEGTHRLSRPEVDALLDDVRGESLLLVDLDQVQSRLLESPWVAAATVRRVLPSTLAVRITERDPLAIARLGQRLYLVDGTGAVIDEFGPRYGDLELPIVDGMAAASSDGSPAVDPGRAELVARLLLSLATRPELRLAVSQVDVSREANVTVLLGDDPTLLMLGDEQFVERLRTYLEIRPTLTDQLEDIDYVDLRFGQRVVAKSRNSLTRR